MRVLILSIIAVDSSDVSLMLRSALIELGCEVEILSYADSGNPIEQALWQTQLSQSDFGLWLFGRKVMRAVKKFQPDMLFLYGSNFFLLPVHLRKLKEFSPCKVVVWEGNLQFWRWYQSEALRYYDHIFVADSYIMPLLRGPAQKSNVHYLRSGCDPAVHRPYEMDDWEKAHYGAEISFIGSGFPNRLTFFEGLTEFDLKLWGRFWDRSPKLAPYYRDEPVYGMKKCKIYGASKISINLQNSATQISGVSCRIFEILACGGFPLTENKADLALYFEVGKEIVAFEGGDDLKEKIRHYLDHPAEREEIARRGRERVLREHTYKHRMAEMLRVIRGAD